MYICVHESRRMYVWMARWIDGWMKIFMCAQSPRLNPVFGSAVSYCPSYPSFSLSYNRKPIQLQPSIFKP